MGRYWRPLAVLLIAILSAAVLFAGRAQPQIDQNNSSTRRKPETIEEVDHTQFPTTDYVAEKQIAGVEREKREKKGKKYNSSHAPPINEFTQQIFSYVDWERGLSAFPFDRSSAVIIGEITAAEAHLSPDETKIYSEFTVQVDKVFKNDKLIPLNTQSKITVERPGGRVRFPSGKVVTAAVSNQDLPRPGRQYVLFLTHDFVMGGSYDETFFIVTAYELRDGQVFPLDKVSSRHPINVYKGSDKELFLNAFTAALANAR